MEEEREGEGRKEGERERILYYIMKEGERERILYYIMKEGEREREGESVCVCVLCTIL